MKWSAAAITCEFLSCFAMGTSYVTCFGTGKNLRKSSGRQTLTGKTLIVAAGISPSQLQRQNNPSTHAAQQPSLYPILALVLAEVPTCTDCAHRGAIDEPPIFPTSNSPTPEQVVRHPAQPFFADPQSIGAVSPL